MVNTFLNCHNSKTVSGNAVFSKLELPLATAVRRSTSKLLGGAYAHAESQANFT